MQCGVWGGGGGCKIYLAPLQVIQRNILRIMSFKSRYDHTAPLFLDFNALTVDRINIYVSVIHVFRCLQNRSNHVFQRYVPLQYQTRLAGANSLIEPDTRSEHSRQSVRWRWRGSHFWNKLPCDITGIHHCNAFKIHLKNFYLTPKYFNLLNDFFYFFRNSIVFFWYFRSAIYIYIYIYFLHLHLVMNSMKVIFNEV